MDELNDTIATAELIVPDYELLLERVELIEYIYENKEKTLFTIKKITRKGFIVIANGFETLVLFEEMPWIYYNSEIWEIIAPYIYGKTFYGTIETLTKNPFEFSISSCFYQFKKANFVINEEYEGLILKKDLTYLLIDLGFHFNWKHGSIIGVLDKSTFLYSNFNPEYNIGKTIKVKYNGLFENGHLDLKKEKDILFWQNITKNEMIGLKVEVRYYKNAVLYNEFWVKDRYVGMLAFEYSIYREELNEIVELRNNLQNNEVIICQIMSINPFIGYFGLKWLAPTKSYLLWHSQEVEDLIGTTAEAKLINKTDQFIFLVNGKYKALMPLSNNFYPENFLSIMNLFYELKIGDVIQCEIVKVNKELKHLLIKYNLDFENNFDSRIIDVDNIDRTNLYTIVEEEENDVLLLCD